MLFGDNFSKLRFHVLADVAFYQKLKRLQNHCKTITVYSLNMYSIYMIQKMLLSQ